MVSRNDINKAVQDSLNAMQPIEVNMTSSTSEKHQIFTVNIVSGNNDIDVNTGLGKNAVNVIIEADEDNTGTATIYLSSDGTNFSNPYTNLRAGKNITLDNCNIDTVRITGTTGDIVRIIAWG